MTKDLTQGKITPLLVKFTIPLLFGNIFQLMYNSVDSIIVGQLVGKEALAAVGTSNPLMTLAILFVNGMCIGASILMGTQYGAKKMDVLKRQISTTMIAGIVFSVVITLFCILFAKPLLMLIQVQEEVLPLAVSYLRIVFLGFIFTFIYNFFACTLRALGDSTTALLGERAAPDLLRLTPRTVSGAEMLQAVCTPVGIAPENVLVLAGSMPMLELVRAASRSAAAADAPAELRLAAKQVTLTDAAGGAAVEVLYRMVRDAEKLA